MIKIEVLEYKPWGEKYRKGYVRVLLGGMIELSCEVMFHLNDQKLWIKLPQRQLGYGNGNSKPEFKGVVFFKNKEFSDYFQKTVTDQLKEKYPLEMVIPPKKLKKEFKSKSFHKKNFNKNSHSSTMSRHATGTYGIKEASDYRDLQPISRGRKPSR